MIDISSETIISLRQAARSLPPGRRGRPVTLSCLLRWVLSGVRTPTGRVCLEAIRMGGRWLTSREALQRFAERLTPEPQDTKRLHRSSAERSKASARADAELQRHGFR
jgi:hypothetical protein